MEERNDQTSCQKLARPRPTAEDTLLRTPSSPPCSSRLSREVTLPTSGPGASARVRNSEAGSVLAPAGLISDCLCVWWQLGRVVTLSALLLLTIIYKYLGCAEISCWTRGGISDSSTPDTSHSVAPSPAASHTEMFCRLG